jgi:hypothetical protein
MSAVPMGKDFCVALYGGDKPHVGAVAIAVPRKSLADPDKTSATTSVIALTGHKEDELAKCVAHKLASTLGCVVTVSCGIHLDNAKPKDILEVEEVAMQLTHNLISRINLKRNNAEDKHAKGRVPSEGPLSSAKAMSCQP